MFVNFSNHPSSNWSEEQRKEAQAFGKILDIPFPAIPAMATTAEVVSMAEYWTEKIQRIRPECIMCQGEFTFTMAVIWRLQKAGIRSVTACTERIAAEEPVRDGIVEKTSAFKFLQFREYEKMGIYLEVNNGSEQEV